VELVGEHGRWRGPRRRRLRVRALPAWGESVELVGEHGRWRGPRRRRLRVRALPAWGESVELVGEHGRWRGPRTSNSPLRNQASFLVVALRAQAGGGAAVRRRPNTAQGKWRIVALVGRVSGGQVAHAAVSRRPPISLYTMVPRTGGFAYDVGVWDLCNHSRTILCRAVPNLG
jgi:hypothetical protein